MEPVARYRVLLAAAALAAVVAGIVALAETLRHPLPSGGPRVPETAGAAADPRTPVECPAAQPREGEERPPDPATGQRIVRVSSNELYDCPEFYDRARVRYRGEVIGGVLHRDGGAWVQLNDDPYADTVGPLPAHRDYRGGNAGIGVFISAELAGEIDMVGGPQTRGDVLQVTGVFHRVDDATAETAIIRASDGRVADPGEQFPDPLLNDRRVVAVMVLACAAAATIFERVAKRRR